MAPEECVKTALADGRRIHLQYGAEFENGVSVARARMPSAPDAVKRLHKRVLSA